MEKFSSKLLYPELLGGVMVGIDPLSHAPVLHGDTFQEVVVHVEANAQREERKLLPHHPLHVLLDGAQLDLAYRTSRKTAYQWMKSCFVSKTVLTTGESISLTHCRVSIRHQNDHGDGSRVNEPLICRFYQHLNCSHQRLINVGAWGQLPDRYLCLQVFRAIKKPPT